MRFVRVPTNGIHLNCAVAGDGPLLLLLHGFPEYWGGWYKQIPALARHFKVVAPDLRGFGGSDKPPTGYDAWTLAGDLLGLIDELGGGRPARVVGHDWGGFIAWALAYLRPDKLDRLTVINSPHPYLYRRKVFTPAQFFKSLYVGFFALPFLPEWFLERRGGAGVETVFRRGAACPEALAREYLDAAKAEMLRPGAIPCGLEYYRVTVRLGEKNVAFMAGVTSVPVQVIWGADDSALGVELLDGLEGYAPRARVHTLPGVGHWVEHEAADETNRLLLEWHLPEQSP